MKKSKNRPIHSFDKRALSYSQNNIIQKQIVLDLLKFDACKHSHILDIGCGDGLIIKNLSYKPIHFVGIDLSANMLKLHPKDDFITTIEKNFDDLSIYKMYTNYTFYSSSALQWSVDLAALLEAISSFSRFRIAIHTSNTFRDLLDFFGLKPFLPTIKYVVSHLPKNIQIDTKKYKIEFKTNQELLKYIQNTGVNNNQYIRSIGDIRDFINKNDKKHLEFEVLFIKNI